MASEHPPISLDAETLRRLGYRVVDLIAEHWEEVGSRPPITVGSPDELAAALGGPPPRAPSDPDAVLDLVADTVLTHVQHGDHPRFFARIPGPSNPVGVLGDALASGFNAFVGSWTGGSGPAALELVTIDWLRQICGLPEGTEGAFVSGGSVASLNAIAVARASRLGGHDPRACVYMSDQAHASIARGLRVLGVAEEQIRVLPSGEDLRLSPDSLEQAVNADRAANRVPFCVVATAGSTNTGAVDPLRELADICERQGLWLHADAAYGGPALLSEAGRRILAGIERVDSLAIDPHKWLFQPYEAGCLLVRHPGALARTFALHPEYLADVMSRDGEVNFFDRGIQLTRGFRALKLWMTIKVYGLDALTRAVEHGIALAEHAEAELRARGGWEIVTPAQLAIVSFRRHGAGDEGNIELMNRLLAGGFAAVSSTVLHGRTVLRMCTINPRTTFEDVSATVERLDELAG